MKTKIVNLSKRPFVRNVIIVTTGTAAAQIITMALSPIITRLYGPEAFGLLGVFVAILAIITPIAALTYPIAIVLPKNDREAMELIRLSLLISIIIASIAFLLILFLKEPIIKLFQIEDIAQFLYFIPLVILFSGFLQVVEQWLIRTKEFKLTAKVTVLQSLILQGGRIGVGLFYPLAFVLIIFNVFGYILKPVLMIFGLKRTKTVKLYQRNKYSLNIKEVARKYKDFPIYRAPEVLINGFSESLPILMLTIFFGPASVGFYSIGRTVLNIPSQLLGKSVGDVFYPRISEAANNGENITKLIIKATYALGVIGVIPFGLIVLFGPTLFSFVFGSEWYTAGEYARWIALWSFSGFINRPSVKSLPVLSAQDFHLKFTILILIIRFTVLAIGYYCFTSDTVAIALFGISGALLNVILILITLKISKKYKVAK